MDGISDITKLFDPRLAALLGWIVVASKVGVDWIKTVTTLPKWAPPAICFVMTAALMLLVMVALGIPITPQLAAQGIIMAIIGTVLAIGSTALQARTNPSTDTTTATAIVDEIEGRLRAEPAPQITLTSPTARSLSEETRRAVREVFPSEESWIRQQGAWRDAQGH